jgi:hypothetical protein
MVKQDLDKLLVVGFIVLVEEASWLSLIIVVLKKNRKLCVCVKFWKLNATTNKKHVPSTIYEGSFGHGGMVARHEMYSFFDEFPNYHHIMIAPEDIYKIAFIMEWGEFV